MQSKDYKVRSIELMAELKSAQETFGPLTIVVDNDCWRATLHDYPDDLSDDTANELYDKMPRGREGPETLAILFAHALGFGGERP